MTVRARLLAILIAAVLVGGVVVVVTNGGDEHLAGREVVTLLAAAPRAVADRGSARLALDVAVSGEGFSGRFRGAGSVDLRTGAGAFEMAAADQKVRTVSDGTTFWVEVPAAARAAADGKAWLATPMSKIDPAATTGLFSQVRSVQGFLAALREVTGRVEDHGIDDVSGVHAHHYRAWVKSARLATDSTSAALLSDKGDVPLDVWVDGAGLPVELELSIKGRVQGRTFHLLMRYRLSHFGEPVEIAPPPADQVKSVPDMAAMQRVLQASG